MANYTTEEYYTLVAQLILPFTALGILNLSGILIQTFIVAVNVLDFLKQNSMTAADQIITSLSISRIIIFLACTLGYLYTLLSGVSGAIFYSVTMLCFQTSSYSSIYLSALLAFFFCLKISNFQNIFALRLKTTISKKVTCMIVASVLLPFAYTFTQFLLFWIFRYLTKPIDSQTAWAVLCMHYFWNIFPLLIYFISSVLLVISLSLHMKRMKNSQNGSNSAGTYHKTIIFTIISFLSCACFILLILNEPQFVAVFGPLWLTFFGNIFPVLHSMFLIYVTTKLRNHFFRIASRAAGCLFNTETAEPDPREQVNVIRL